MRLARLIYEIIMETNPEATMSFENFIDGSHDKDREFTMQISSVFYFVNLAMSRLFTDKKTKLKYMKATPNDNGYFVFPYGEVVSVLDTIASDGYKRFKWLEYDKGIAVEKDAIGKGELFVEYRPSIPDFAMESSNANIGIRKIQGEEIVENVVELDDYGVTNDMASYVKQYALGGCLKFISPSIAQNDINMAEAAFAKIRASHTNFPQASINTCKGLRW